jgi:carboxynorspermidine decarboxylase
VGAGQPGEQAHTYRLAGLTCLAGDVIGDYSFPHELAVGDQVVFGDMAHYSMVKATTFNGVRLPSIATFDPATGSLTLVRRFGYPTRTKILAWRKIGVDSESAAARGGSSVGG